MGAAAATAEGDAALQRIMKKDDAIKYLLPVFDQATLMGKCYALIGIRLLSPKYFEPSSQRLARWYNTQIPTISGCIPSNQKLADVIQKIRRGEYDDEVLGKSRER